MMFVGFMGWRALQARAPRAEPSVTASASPSTEASEHVERAATPPVQGAGSSAQAVQAGGGTQAVATDAVQGFGRVLPFIDRSRGVPVAPDQGLLVVEYEAAGPPPRIRIGDRELGPAPVAAALPAGRHELVLKRDAQTSFRYVVIRSGETRIVQVRD
jgi:hypothetical protein